MKGYNSKIIKTLVISLSGFLTFNSIYATETSSKSDSQKQSYSMGVVVGKQILNSISQEEFKLDKPAFSEGLTDVINNKKIKISDADIQKNLLNFTKKQTETYNSEVEAKAKNNLSELLETKNIPVIGSPDANIAIVEFFDYNCGHCKLMAKPLKDFLEKNKDVKLLLRMYPIMGGNSNYAAKAVLWTMEDKANIDKTKSLHDSLISKPSVLKSQDIKDLMKASGLDADKFDKEVSASDINELVESNFKLASKLGLKGTPSLFFINAKNQKIHFVSGAVTNEVELKKIVDELK